MTPAELIGDARADGVIVALSAAGTLKASGEPGAVARWLPALRAHKAAVIEVLARQPVPPFHPSEENAIRAWLASIDESDAANIAEVLERCRANMGARAYFLARAAEIAANAAPASDDRRTCRQCRNLSRKGRCLAAARGEVVASRDYAPIRDTLRRCDRYLPDATDEDRRSGIERWPGLNDSAAAIKELAE